MALARRGFISTSAMAGAALALLRVPGGSALAAIPPASAGAGAGDGLDGHSLAALAGRRFQVDCGTGAPVSLQLTEVETRDADGRCFSLIFRADAPGALSEGIHGFSAEGCRPFAAFIAPVERDGRSWQVVFNRA